MPGFARLPLRVGPLRVGPLRLGMVAGLLLTAAAASALAAEERIGVNTAVNPDATGAPPGATARRLVISQDVIFNEHITTGPSGQTQILFLDESSMTVGPNSDLTIDQFVYDPKAGTGKLAMSATRGLMRYVGGKLSKNEDAVTLHTATATLAVRGGSYLTRFDADKTEAAFLYGNQLKIAGAVGEPQIIRRTGWGATVLRGGAASAAYRVPPQRLAQDTQQLDGQSGSTGGATVIPTDATVVNSGVPKTISGDFSQSLQQAESQSGTANIPTPNPNPPSAVNTQQSTASQGATGLTQPSILAPTGATRIFAFNLAPSPSPSNIPFSPNEIPLEGAIGGSPTPLYLVAPASTAIGDTSTASTARELNATVVFLGQGSAQSSTAVVAGGLVTTLQSNGAPILVGAVRGVESVTSGVDGETITSPVSGLLDTTNLSSTLDQTLYNTNSNRVATGPSASQPGELETEFVATAPATETFGFSQPAVPTTVPAGVGTSRTTQTLTGFFGGLMATTATSTPYALTGTATIATNSVANSVTANFASDHSLSAAATGGVTSIAMNFGGTQSAFIDDNIFGALENTAVPQQINGQSLQVGGSTANAGQLYLVSSATAALPTALLPSGASFCQCAYLKWGYWGGDLRTGNASNNTLSRVDHGHINFWAAGTPTPAGDLNTLAGQNASGTYNGAAIGSVDNAGARYVAAGGFTGTFNFGTHSGTWALTNFDGHNFSAAGNTPLNGSSYSVSGSAGGLAGSFNGSFYGPLAAETGGNFSLHSIGTGPVYLASGIFAGKR
ncbi:MAG TPA: FecR domain-containing protein [Stellaceae bacterium]|nr:FecR domain-containing protein [Stellaceae bacterium]